MKKMQLITPALILTACACAQAAGLAKNAPIPLPALSMPLSIPVSDAHIPSMPSFPIMPAVIPLPPFERPIPTIMPTHPVPLPVVDPGVILPPAPIAHLPLRMAAALGGRGEAAPLPQRARELDRVYDNTERPFTISEDDHYTTPEKDLLDEIGVAAHAGR